MHRVRTHRSLRQALAVAVCAALKGLLLGGLRADGPPSRRIAAFGSSVSFGTGDEYGREGYTGMLRGLLAPMGWMVLNQSGASRTR